MKRPAVFLDRDGTINEQMGYINHLSRFNLLPGVCDAVRLLNENGFLTVIISNQSGVARGYFPINLVYQVHDLMKTILKEKEAIIDGIFFCPHHPKGVVPEYTCKCGCRKPKMGLIDRACNTFDIDMSNSYMIGDRHLDIELAQRCDLKSVLVKTGYGLGETDYILPQKEIKPSYVAWDLLHAVHWILEK